MRIGVVSDTHRNRELLNDVVDWMIGKRHITTLYHLGDDYADTADLGDKGVDIVQIPGLYDIELTSGAVPGTLVENVLGLSILLVHSLDREATDDELRINQIILHGHTHKHEMHLVDGVLFLNPGHCKGPMDKHEAGSFAVLDIQEKSVKAEIFDLGFQVIAEMRMIREENGLYKA